VSKKLDAEQILNHAKPIVGQHGHETQPFGHVLKMPIALEAKTCSKSVENLNQLLADTITLRDLYKKHHWQVAGPTFYCTCCSTSTPTSRQPDRYRRRARPVAGG
jgi:starvation-inducible DNA-binding protein